MSTPEALGPIRSDALKRNMDLTNVPVEVSPLFEVLRDAVKDYAGKEQQTLELLKEYHHQYRNWLFVVQESWRYAVSNLRIYSAHPQSGRIVFLLCRLMLEALKESERSEVRSLAGDNLLAYLLKLLDEMGPEITRPMPEGVSVEDIAESPEGIDACHEGILCVCFKELAALPPKRFEYVMRSYYQPKRLAAKLLKIQPRAESLRELRLLLQRLLKESCLFWLGREDPTIWLQEKARQLGAPGTFLEAGMVLSHERLREHLRVLVEEIEPEPLDAAAIERLLQVPDFREVVQAYHKLPDRIKARDDFPRAAHLSMLMRFKIMETKGLERIHEEILREINFDLANWIRQKSMEERKEILERIFEVLKGCMDNHPEGALQCIRTIGLEVLETEDSCFIDFFLKRLIRMGFQTPQLGGVSQHWQVRVNPAHLLNIRIWLEFIKKNPTQTKSLLSALILYLTLGGVYIRDTDLFQKDVSQLLHAPIRPVYNLVKQLAKLFPVYFNQIGAEGQLRSVSTEVDELTMRKDRLIHFLRKQSHVEGNNLIVDFIEAIIDFWRTRDKTRLRNFVPDEVYRDVPDSGPLVEEIHCIFDHIFHTTTIHHVEDLLDVAESEVQRLINDVPGVSDGERQRAFLIVRFYQLLHEKYALTFKDIDVHLQRAASLGLPDPTPLLEALKSRDSFEKLDAILDYLVELKEIILAPGELSYIENIYHKRHIAVDIPSMYGSYNERKFDALGLIFRLESLANLFFEEIILSFNLSFITRATFFRIAKFLPLFQKALASDGITSTRLEGQTELFQKALEIRRFSHSQYIDVFRGFSEAIKQIIQTYYDAVHESNLELIIRHIQGDSLLPRYRRESKNEGLSEQIQRISETFLRDLVARTFGLQYFDHFISSILTTLAAQTQVLSKDKLDLLLSYDPEKTISPIYNPNPMTYDLIHLGAKGLNLTQLHGLGVRVPSGFVITSEYFRCRSVIEGFVQSREDFEERVMGQIRELERVTGRSYGSANNSLLLSVRSGAAVSMPGMMTSFLNVGINEEIVEGLIAQTKQAWFAWDNYRRFLQSWGMSYGMQRDEFDAMMNSFKKRYRRHVKREFVPDEIRELVLYYKQALRAYGVDLSEDPKEQLFTAIRQVVNSWYSHKAETYRNIMGLSENWGTAVTIQAMIFGNLNNHSGAGVMFTHNPWTSEEQIEPNGDFTLGNQGEDVVGGLVKTLPLSEKQRLSLGERKEHSLESLFPRVYRKLYEVAEKLVIQHNWSPQEIEFTFQGRNEDGVFILQSRNMGPRVRRIYPVFKPSEQLSGAYVGSGIGVSGGALCGKVAFDLESIKELRSQHPDQPIILIRSDTVPDDIREISIADGILTGKGGATSHAAIVAHRLHKTCVVGFSKMRVWETDRKCVMDGKVLRTGDFIGIDGRSGAIYLGHHVTEKVDLVA